LFWGGGGFEKSSEKEGEFGSPWRIGMKGETERYGTRDDGWIWRDNRSRKEKKEVTVKVVLFNYEARLMKKKEGSIIQQTRQKIVLDRMDGCCAINKRKRSMHVNE